MSIYPTLEDMAVDQLQKSQVEAAQQLAYHHQQQQPVDGALAMLYPSLMDDYMGMRLEPPSGPVAVPSAGSGPPAPGIGWNVAPLSGGDKGMARASVNHGIRQVICCKDADNKIGLRLREISKGIFVQFVNKNSPAALAGIRFGDQILQVDGKNVMGLTAEKAMDLVKKCANPQRITFAIRDRPFERTVTMHKDSTGHVGFVYKEGKITSIAVDTSAARNGLLIDHQIMEVNGQNVLGLKDKDLAGIFASTGGAITLTIMPSMIYEHMIKKLGSGLLRKEMDHSIPEV